MSHVCPTCGRSNDPRPSLTKRQAHVLDVIQMLNEGLGRAPTMWEVAYACEYRSLATVHEHVTNLRSKGYLPPVTRPGGRANLVPV